MRGRPAWRSAVQAPIVALMAAVMVAGCASPQPLPTLEPRPSTAAPTPTPTPTAPGLPPTTAYGQLNPAHLDFLTEPIAVDGRPMAIVHIYSEAPEYRWVDASGEGISALDDIARAALVYLDLAQRTGTETAAADGALARARMLLETTLYLQTEDGRYYNFLLDRAGMINLSGPTSYADWGWWAARGQLALAHGYGVFRSIDEALAARLRDGYMLGEAALERALEESSAADAHLHGVRQPSGLLNGGTDVSSLALLGLAEWQAVDPSERTRRLAFRLAQAVVETRAGDGLNYPFGLRPSSTSSTAFWHAWGAHEVEALARAGAVFARADWIRAAEAEAETWYGRLLTDGMLREVGVLPRRYDQIAYGQAPIVRGLAQLAAATGDDRYRRLAGLAAAWFEGDNAAAVAMYDAATGRGFDGILGSTALRINRNAGAESTIEALLALLAVVDDPVALPYLDARSDGRVRSLVSEAERGRAVAGTPRYGAQNWTGEAFYSNGHYMALSPGDAIGLPFNIDAAGDYDLYLAHVRQAPVARRLDLEAVRAPEPPAIDGDPADWPPADPASVASAEQILRGASGWPGPEQASFEFRLAWDADNLYLAADVRKPNHVQTSIGPDVWRGDALWVYLDTTGAGQRVDVKLTLAQTPQGPQVWDWVGQGFLPNALLTWQATDGGFRYEAALPWPSLHRAGVAAGDRLGFEVGMSFTGAFMDWTGTDPDTPSNLAPLGLVEEAGESDDDAARDPRPDAAAVRLELDGQQLGEVAERTSPDRDYLWLEHVADRVRLAAGAHEVVITGIGRDTSSESMIDGIWLVPRPIERRWELPDGTEIVLRFDAEDGSLELIE
ncbi:hypothetical protein BH23CHL7_BH23CHL7_20040 [soil metagenome]